MNGESKRKRQRSNAGLQNTNDEIAFDNSHPVVQRQPTPPNLTLKDLRSQFWADVFGKEVQTAATYSYTWIADQFGHVAIGLMAHFICTLVAGWTISLINFLSLLPILLPLLTFLVILIIGFIVALTSIIAPISRGPLIGLISLSGAIASGFGIAYLSNASINEPSLYAIWLTGLQAPYSSVRAMLWGLITALVFIAIWELQAYRKAVEDAPNNFLLDRQLLRDNAIAATAYMGLGALLGFAFHLRAMPTRIPEWIPSWFTVPPWLLSWIISTAAVSTAIVLALPWLRQKIIWQKAGLPYLCRLADTTSTISKETAKALKDSIDAGAPPGVAPCAFIIYGPIGSGRTAVAASIGTEFAFRNYKVRYLSFDALIEFAVSSSGYPLPDDRGPQQICYWPWSEAQVLIVDNVGPLIGAQDDKQRANLERFRRILLDDLQPIRSILTKCHTVWVIGDLRTCSAIPGSSAVLQNFSETIQNFCTHKNSITIALLKNRDATDVSR